MRRQEVGGKVKKAKGRVKEAVGILSGNKKMKHAGSRQRVEGAVQEGFGKAYNMIGNAIAGGSRGGCLVSIVLGFIGALLGSWVARQMKLPEPFVLHAAGQAFPILWSVIGAALFVMVVHLFRRRR
jgi:uncharacterized membrane protein YeaQ/YmgE (transglycosylase-associated protein family)